jgi:PAS domain-containing protein
MPDASWRRCRIIGRRHRQEGLDGFITSWNAGAERLYGYFAKEASGSTSN